VSALVLAGVQRSWLTSYSRLEAQWNMAMVGVFPKFFPSTGDQAGELTIHQKVRPSVES